MLKKEILDILNIPGEWNYKIEKVTYVTFCIESEESYAEGLKDAERRREQETRTGRVYYDCSHIPVCNSSISIKANLENYEKIVEEKYEEFKNKYGDRFRSIYLT